MTYFNATLLCYSFPLQVCQEFNTTWAWELEQKGYKELTVECKTGILKVSLLLVDVRMAVRFPLPY